MRELEAGTIRGIGLPADLFAGVLPHEVERYRQHVACEAPYELRRHPEAARLTGSPLSHTCAPGALTDDLVDLLIETIHHIGARAERKVERELLDDLKRVTGKQNLLFELADAALEPSRTASCGMSSTRSSASRPCATWSRNGKARARPIGPSAHGDPQLLQRPLPPHGARSSRPWSSARTTRTIARSSTPSSS